MINLATCKRPEFIEHEANLQGYIKHLEDELEIVNNKLQEYEGVQLTKDQEMKEFEHCFWEPYGKKGNKKTTFKLWRKLSKKKQTVASDYAWDYAKATPDKAYRKNAETFIRQECWNDQLPETPNDRFGRPPAVRAMTSIIEDNKEEDKRLEEAAKLRQASRGRNVRDLLK